MKHRLPLTLTVATVAAVATGAVRSHAQDQDNAPDTTAPAGDTTPDAEPDPLTAAPPGTSPLPESIRNMGAEEREKLSQLISDASRYITGVRLQEAFEKILEAEEMAPDLFQVHNLKGAAYTKLPDYDKARVSFQKAIDLAPPRQKFMAMFNITELDFVEHKFEDAEKNFSALLEADPDMQLGTRRLIEFKILISRLALDKDAEAMALLDTFNYLEDTPAYYLGHAAVAFDKGDEDAAREWIRSAERIYSPQEVSVYVDSFVEMDWIDNLQ